MGADVLLVLNKMTSTHKECASAGSIRSPQGFSYTPGFSRLLTILFQSFQIQLHNPYKTSAEKTGQTRASIQPQFQLQNLDQTLCSKNE